MGLFDKKSPEEKEAQEAAKLVAALEKYGLNLDSYDEATIRDKNIENMKALARDLVGSSWFKASMTFSFAKAEEQLKVGYLSALFQQNWILIRQQEQVIRLLTRLANGDRQVDNERA